MTGIHLIPSSFFLLIASCNIPDTKTADIPQAEPAPVMHSKDCYVGTSLTDTIKLSFTPEGNRVTGELTYQLGGKDKNSGTIDGKFRGDTLLVDYTFNSEGVESVREIVFLKTGDSFREGYSEMKEHKGKMVFNDISKSDFSGSLSLKNVPCE
jgi:hypothetical protein